MIKFDTQRKSVKDDWTHFNTGVLITVVMKNDSVLLLM